jgi:hypothetical protein
MGFGLAVLARAAKAGLRPVARIGANAVPRSGRAQQAVLRHAAPLVRLRRWPPDDPRLIQLPFLDRLDLERSHRKKNAGQSRRFSSRNVGAALPSLSVFAMAVLVLLRGKYPGKKINDLCP